MKYSVLQYIEQPALLAEVSLEELVTQLEQYPYSTNLRLLVLLRAKQLRHPDFEEFLATCAASTFDRAQLYNVLAAVEEKEELHGEVLELMELEELELAPLDANFSEIPSRMNDLADAPPEPNRVPVTEVRTVSLEPFEAAPRAPELSPAEARTRRWVRMAEAYTLLLPMMFRSPRPEDPSRFTSVTGRHQATPTLRERLQRLRQLAQHREEKSAATGVEEVAVVSETLAALLVRQEQYDSAIRMYRRLILLYPDKKPIFAGLIQELKQKL